MGNKKKDLDCNKCSCRKICFLEKPDKVIDETDEAREYLLKFVAENFKDKTFEKYIKNNLAGDFIFNLVEVLRTAEALNEKIKEDLIVVLKQQNRMTEKLDMALKT